MTAGEIASIPRIGLTEEGVESVIRRLTMHVRETMTGGKSAGSSF